MKTRLKLLAAAIAIASTSANAVGLITGPATGKETGRFPAYYQDLNGVALEHCLPNASELNTAACLLAPEDVTNPLLPILFPTNFPGETFFFAADSVIEQGNIDALLVMALEATFSAEEPVDGDQILFARIRFRFVAPVTGTYLVEYPYGEQEVEATAGERVFFTDDHGINCGQDFSCAADGQIGPYFLRPLGIDGNPAPYYEANGKTYLADPGVATQVTGGSHGNVFKITGPAGSDLNGAGGNVVETDLFTLVGRVKTDPLPSNISIEKSIYSRSGSDGTALTKIDVNVKSVKGLNQPNPQLKLFGSNMPGITLTQDGVKQGQYYGQVLLEGHKVPDKVYVSDLLEQSGRVIPVTLTDQVTVKQANYDTATKALHIEAESSDKINTGTGSVKLTAYGSDGKELGDLDSDGKLDVTLAADAVPPANVLVNSNKHGHDRLGVTTTASAVPNVPVLETDDDLDVDETQPINVLEGDTIGASPVKVRIVSKPAHGNLVVNDADDTVSYSQSESVPDNTQDSFTYYLTDDDGNISNVSTVSFMLSAANLPPTANSDNASVSAGSSVTIDVLANDSDPDAGDVIFIESVSDTVHASISEGKVVYNATGLVGGQYSFTYTVNDGHGHPVNGTVTVTVTQPITVTIAVAEFRTSRNQWRVSGSVLPAFVGMTVKVYVDTNGNNSIEPGTDRFVGETLALDAADAAAGAWDFRSTTVAGANNGVRILAVSSLGGVVGQANLLVRR